jgi:hypothetical protein
MYTQEVPHFSLIQRSYHFVCRLTSKEQCHNKSLAIFKLSTTTSPSYNTCTYTKTFFFHSMSSRGHQQTNLEPRVGGEECSTAYKISMIMVQIFIFKVLMQLLDASLYSGGQKFHLRP